MAKNDVVLLDGIVDRRVADALPSGQRDEVFEYLAFEQTLKDYDLSREEIESGWVDGKDDGGLDGFFTIVNGHLLRDPDSFAWPKRNAVIDVWLITAKHHSTFQQGPLNSILATMPELFDLARDRAALKSAYSEALIRARSLFHLAYRRLSFISPTLTFRFQYVSRGDSSEVADNVRARAEQITTLAESMFSSSIASFGFVGAAELVVMYRRTKTFSLELPFLEYLARSGDSYVLLARLDDYCRFVTDEQGHLRRYLFDSNVRDYLGENRVNEDIGLSLRDDNGSDFWWLNNGVTILSTGATVLGKAMQLQDVQIVNGLQTTESIFRPFASGCMQSMQRALLVKVVVSNDSVVRDQIIRATNNQSIVEVASLHATDKIQRDIDEVLERSGWFYERRKNYYRNIGKPEARFVTPMYIAAGCVALVLRNPAVAARLKSRFMRIPESYAAVFSEELPLDVWPVIAEVLKRAGEVLREVRPAGGGKGERLLASWRNLLALLVVARMFGTFAYSITDLATLDTSKLSKEMILDSWEFLNDLRRTQHDHWDHVSHGEYHCVQAAATYGLAGVQIIGKRKLTVSVPKQISLSEVFIDVVDRALPPQPWKPKMHVAIAAQLKCKPAKVSAAINTLVARGKWMAQRGGVVYDKNGAVVAVDNERVQAQPAESEADRTVLAR